MATKTGRIIGRSENIITIEWDGVYGGSGTVVSVDGIDYTILDIVSRGPNESGKFVTRGSVLTEDRLSAEREQKKADALASARALTTDDM